MHVRIKDFKIKKKKSWNQACREKYQYLRYANNITLMAENEEELKSLIMRMKEEDEKLA